MALTPGCRVGPYEIVSLLGAGGMGEVYRARDTKLSRDVAIKVLPDSFASDAERLARFTREAQTLASLDHPNIAHIFGLEESGGVRALVMEMVEGDDLSQRIARGTVPLDEALLIAKQIADALAAAHEQGIIHRDLKPANIKVRPDGTVKVLDFGLAKAMEPPASASYVSQSPTITTPAMTVAGMILGTAAYMSPEQARGRSVDKRTDIWAFGAVLYEMLTGTRAFDGEDATEVIAAVVKTTPDWTRLPKDLPSGIAVLIQRCLEKDRKARIGDIAAAQFVLQESAAVVPGTRRAAPVRRWRSALPWALTSAAIIGFLLVRWWPGQPAVPPPALSRLSVDLGADVSLVTTAGPGMILSRDGTLLVFVGEKTAGAVPQLYARRLDQLQAVALVGTEGARNPFFSPDGRNVAFFAQGKLKKAAVAGGVITLCDAADDRGGAWADDGRIVFAPQNRGALWQVPAVGGTPEALTTFAPGEVTHRWPQVLPGSKAVIFTTHTSTLVGYEDANVVVQSLPDGERTVLQSGAFQGRYLSSGHLTYVHQGTVFAASFDLSRLQVIGPPAPVLQGVNTNTAPGGAQWAVSDAGTAVYLPGSNDRDERPISWVDRRGQTTPLRPTPSYWRAPRFSPDGLRIAMETSNGRNRHVLIYDWARDLLTPLTLDAADHIEPTWTPDGKRITFAYRGAEGVHNLYWQRADGTGEAQRLTTSPDPQVPGSWHPDGRRLAFDQRGNIMMLPIEGDEIAGWKPGAPTVLLATPASETHPAFSPDGRWIAYQSTGESGPGEVYVRPFPGPGGTWRVSNGGGDFPVWSKTRHELLYSVLQTNSVMAVPYTVDGDSFRAEKPRPWSDRPVLAERGNFRGYDLHPDGERLAVGLLPEQGEAKQNQIVVVFNFLAELSRTAAVTNR